MQKKFATKAAILLSSGAMLLTSGTAFAGPHDRGIFVGGNLGYITSESVATPPNSGLDVDETNFRGVELNFGYKYNNWLGIDIRFGSGLGEDSYSLPVNPQQTIHYSLDGYTAVYFRPEITNDEARLYFLLGRTSFDVSSEIVDSEGNDVDWGDDWEGVQNFSGASYGLGAGWYYGPDFTFNVELRKLVDDDSDEFTSVHFGMDYRFNYWKL